MNTQLEIIKKVEELSDLALKYSTDIEENKLTPDKYTDDVILDFSVIAANIFINRVYYSAKNMENGVERARMCGEDIKDLIMKWTGVDTLKYYDRKI